MGTEERASVPHLKEALQDIEQQGKRFSFYRLLYLMERVYADAPPLGGLGPVADERIRLRPSASLAFPSSDIEEVKEMPCGDGVSRTRVTATFLGLYGSSSPLPNYFNEQIAHTEYQGQREAVRELLDVVHNRLYGLLYRAWAKYRLGVSYRKGGADSFTRRMFCLTGVDAFGHEASPIERFLFLRYAPHLAMKLRSARGLEIALRDLFLGIGSRVEQFIGAWSLIEKPYRNRMGLANNELGVSLTIGKYVFDASSRYKIVLGPLSYDDYLAFLPGGHKRPLLRGICAVFTRGVYDVSLELHVRPEAAPRFQLGAPRASTLKRTAWLGGQKDVPFVLSVPLEDATTEATDDDDRGEPPPNPFGEA
jgi:type VI secretion system protein ImpH